MGIGSTLDPDAIGGAGVLRPPGHDTRSLGPGDLSDTGSDSIGPSGLDPAILAEDGDSSGTGVDPSPADPRNDDTDADIGFDRVVSADEAGLGRGLDQAEEARSGVQDPPADPLEASPDATGTGEEGGADVYPDAPDEAQREGGAIFGSSARDRDALDAARLASDVSDEDEDPDAAAD